MAEVDEFHWDCHHSSCSESHANNIVWLNVLCRLSTNNLLSILHSFNGFAYCCCFFLTIHPSLSLSKRYWMYDLLFKSPNTSTQILKMHKIAQNMCTIHMHYSQWNLHCVFLLVITIGSDLWLHWNFSNNKWLLWHMKCWIWLWMLAQSANKCFPRSSGAIWRIQGLWNFPFWSLFIAIIFLFAVGYNSNRLDSIYFIWSVQLVHTF